jgi:hypothetical protein
MIKVNAKFYGCSCGCTESEYVTIYGDRNKVIIQLIKNAWNLIAIAY